MIVLDRLRLKLLALFRKEEVDAEMDEEIRYHIEAETEKNVRAGMTRKEARRKAMIDFGGVERYREQTREARGVRPLEIALDETRYALRRLARSPLFTLVSILTLALGIGATTAIFTLLDRVVLDPLPYPQSDRLVRLKSPVPGVGPDVEWESSTAQFFYYSADASTLEAVGGYRRGAANLLTPSGPVRVRMALVTSSLLPLLGARPELGRLLDVQDDPPGAPMVAVLSHAFWVREMGADSAVLGQVLQVNEAPVEVVGVLAPGVELPYEPGMPAGMEAEIWVPVQWNPAGPWQNNHVHNLVARLAPGATLETAQAELDRLVQRLPDLYPSAYSRGFVDEGGFHTRLYPLKSYIVGDLSQRLWILMGAVGVVLLIACANVVNLFLVRMESRRRELAIRAALGAGEGAVLRPVLAESLMLALAGGATAMVVGLYAVRLLLPLAPGTIPTLAGVGVDGDLLLFTLLLSLGVAGALTVLSSTRHRKDLAVGALMEAGYRSTAGRDRQRLRSGLVVGQVSLALVLIVGAGLLVQSFRALLRVDPGFDPDGALTVQLNLSGDRYPDTESMWAFYDQVLESVRALPGVTSAGMSDELPFTGGYGCTVQGFEDPEVYDYLQEAGLTTCAGQASTTPGYFEAAGIGLVQGRFFDDADNDQPGQGAVVVSRAFADRFWPGQDPLGKGVAASGRTDPPFYHVVGVAEDVYSSSLEEDPALAIYYPVVRIPDTWGWWPTSMNLVVRTELAEPLSLYPAIRRAVLAVDPAIPAANPTELSDLQTQAMSRITFTLVLLGVAAGVALLLAGIGLYGVVSYLVARRRGEIGVRIALGAEPGAVEGMVVWGSLKLAGLGLVLGLGGAFAFSRILGSLLYGVAPTAPAAYLAAGGLVLGVAFLASWIPSRRAARVSPLDALRVE